jgi:hypothetical protein
MLKEPPKGEVSSIALVPEESAEAGSRSKADRAVLPAAPEPAVPPASCPTLPGRKESGSNSASPPSVTPDAPPAPAEGAGGDSPIDDAAPSVSGSEGLVSAGGSGAARSGPTLPASGANGPQKSSGKGLALKTTGSAIFRSGRSAVPAGATVRVGVASSSRAVRAGEGGVSSRVSGAGRPTPTRTMEVGGPVSAGAVSIRDSTTGWSVPLVLSEWVAISPAVIPKAPPARASRVLPGTKRVSRVSSARRAVQTGRRGEAWRRRRRRRAKRRKKRTDRVNNQTARRLMGGFLEVFRQKQGCVRAGQRNPSQGEGKPVGCVIPI